MGKDGNVGIHGKSGSRGNVGMEGNELPPLFLFDVSMVAVRDVVGVVAGVVVAGVVVCVVSANVVGSVVVVVEVVLSVALSLPHQASVHLFLSNIKRLINCEAEAFRSYHFLTPKTKYARQRVTGSISRRHFNKESQHFLFIDLFLIILFI